MVKCRSSWLTQLQGTASLKEFIDQNRHADALEAGAWNVTGVLPVSGSPGGAGHTTGERILARRGAVRREGILPRRAT